MLQKEGLRKYDLEYRAGPSVDDEKVQEMNSFVNLLRVNGLIGVGEGKVGYGNASLNFNGESVLITSTGIGKIRGELSRKDLALILDYDADKNLADVAEGMGEPSAELPTHWAVNRAKPDNRWVGHGHVRRELWEVARRLAIPVTREYAEYGSTEMVEEVARLFRETNVSDIGMFAMGGHEGGLVAFGQSPENVVSLFRVYIARAQAYQF